MARKTKKFGSSEGSLNITSMMDMFTIVLVFLLKSFSAEGNLLTQADNLQLPYSTSNKTVTEIALTVVVDEKHVVVDQTPVVETRLVASQDSLLVAPMYEALKQKREEETKLSLQMGEDPGTGKVIVQLDKNTTYDVMYKVMATCGYSGYSNVSFAVVQKEGVE